MGPDEFAMGDDTLSKALVGLEGTTSFRIEGGVRRNKPFVPCHFDPTLPGSSCDVVVLVISLCNLKH